MNPEMLKELDKLELILRGLYISAYMDGACDEKVMMGKISQAHQDILDAGFIRLKDVEIDREKLTGVLAKDLYWASPSLLFLADKILATPNLLKVRTE